METFEKEVKIEMSDEAILEPDSKEISRTPYICNLCRKEFGKEKILYYEHIIKCVKRSQQFHMKIYQKKDCNEFKENNSVSDVENPTRVLRDSPKSPTNKNQVESINEEFKIDIGERKREDSMDEAEVAGKQYSDEGQNEYLDDPLLVSIES